MKVRVTLSDGFKTALVILFLSISLAFSPRNLSEKPKELEIPDIGNVYFTSTAVDPEPEEIEVIPEPEPIVEVIPEPVEPEFEGVSEKDIELIALVTMAEAEGECEKGKRLVIDTILNRVDSKHFPDTVYDVVYQKNQFTSMWNGRVDRCYVKEDICTGCGACAEACPVHCLHKGNFICGAHF